MAIKSNNYLHQLIGLDFTMYLSFGASAFNNLLMGKVSGMGLAIGSVVKDYLRARVAYPM